MNKTHDQLHLKQRQQDILLLLYKFRFLNRKQIQQLLNHKSHSLLQEWLNKLVNEKLIIQYYDYKIAPSPAVYALDKAGRKFLKDRDDVSIEALQRVWREKNYSDTFREHCQFVADLFLKLSASVVEWRSELQFKTKSELYGMEHMIAPPPDAYISIKDSEGNYKRYLMDIFDDIPPVALRKRVKEYLRYYESDEWQDNTDKPFPEILLICPKQTLKSHLFYFIKNKMRDNEEPAFYLSLKNHVATKGLSRETLQRVMVDE